ncbi:hypothetical protein [Lacrimispora sp.]|uniref:hypothetical protein n=1 Tax=Lacrimispora sp. TaxID=2719234 RepID=UPI0028A650D7|nr:hypothetical protein [Lacrimispora sp.]
MAKRMNDEQNLRFMTDPMRLAAESEQRGALEEVRGISTLTAAQTVLICMPPALKRLEAAHNKLITVEAQLEHDILICEERECMNHDEE